MVTSFPPPRLKLTFVLIIHRIAERKTKLFQLLSEERLINFYLFSVLSDNDFTIIKVYAVTSCWRQLIFPIHTYDQVSNWIVVVSYTIFSNRCNIKKTIRKRVERAPDRGLRKIQANAPTSRPAQNCSRNRATKYRIWTTSSSLGTRSPGMYLFSSNHQYQLLLGYLLWHSTETDAIARTLLLIPLRTIACDHKHL